MKINFLIEFWKFRSLTSSIERDVREDIEFLRTTLGFVEERSKAPLASGPLLLNKETEPSSIFFKLLLSFFVPNSSVPECVATKGTEGYPLL